MERKTQIFPPVSDCVALPAAVYRKISIFFQLLLDLEAHSTSQADGGGNSRGQLWAAGEESLIHIKVTRRLSS